MSTFAALKKSSGSIDKLARELEKLNAPATNSLDDTRFWKPELDKAGNGFATIRFLPAQQLMVMILFLGFASLIMAFKVLAVGILKIL